MNYPVIAEVLSNGQPLEYQPAIFHIGFGPAGESHEERSRRLEKQMHGRDPVSLK